MSEDDFIGNLAKLVTMDKIVSEKLLISEFVEDLKNVWNNYDNILKKWEERSNE